MKPASRTNTYRLTYVRRVGLILFAFLTFLPVVTAKEFRAGAARIDMTPPPGFPTGGHGPVGAIARGHLTRLYVRAVFFQDANGYPLLLVSVESFAVPQIFRKELQKRFEQQTKVKLPLASIIISATHTHQGPGNYFSAAVLNHEGSPISGYAVKLREFLIDRIVSASVSAYNNAQSSTSVTAQTRKALLPLESLRNRSPDTFMLNREAQAMMTHFDYEVRELGGELAPSNDKACARQQKEREQEGGWDILGCPRLRAVDRVMTILDVADSKGPIATIVFGAVHPTVAPPDTPLFSSDFVGLAMRQLELKAPRGRLVAAFFNGAEGDITARRIERDIRDVWQHSRVMRDAIEGAKKRQKIDLTKGIESRVHFAGAGDALSGYRLASNPKPGVALLGGGEGDRTPLYNLGWKERERDHRAAEGQGAKRNALKSTLLPFVPDLTSLLATSDDFPRVLPLGYARLGTLEIVSTPTEMSTATGYNIRKELTFDTVLIGLANEYASYTATADEYARQDYMGASTLWGPQESGFFVRALSILRTGSIAGGADPVDRPGKKKLENQEFDVGERRQAVDEDLDLLLRDRNRNPVRDLPYITWSDRESSDTYAETANSVVAIEEEGGTLVEDDSAGRLILLLREKPNGGVRQWAAIWLAPLDDSALPRRVVFTVRTASGQCYRSQPFDPAVEKNERILMNAPCRAQTTR